MKEKKESALGSRTLGKKIKKHKIEKHESYTACASNGHAEHTERKSLENFKHKLQNEVDIVLRDVDFDEIHTRDDIDRLLKVFKERGLKAEARFSKVQLAFKITVWKEEYITKCKYGTITPKHEIEVIQKKPWMLGKRRTASSREKWQGNR